MKKFIGAIVLAAGVAATPFIAIAGPVEDAVKARQSVMQIYEFNLGKLGAMAKGDMDYNAELAQASADNLKAAVTMKNGAMWPPGSGDDNIGLEVKTRALPAIWSTYPAIADKSKALVAAASAMADAAGSGVDGIRGNIGAVGKACKGCHTDFRAERN